MDLVIDSNWCSRVHPIGLSAVELVAAVAQVIVWNSPGDLRWRHNLDRKSVV